MSFSFPLLTSRRHGVEIVRIQILLTVLSPSGEVTRAFRLDTGADITTVSEDVAATCGLPAGGAPLTATGVGGPATGRLVEVRYRFPADDISGTDGVEGESRWLVVPNRTQTALLSLADVHRYLSIGTDDENVYFAER